MTLNVGISGGTLEERQIAADNAAVTLRGLGYDSVKVHTPDKGGYSIQAVEMPVNPKEASIRVLSS